MWVDSDSDEGAWSGGGGGGGGGDGSREGGTFADPLLGSAAVGEGRRGSVGVGPALQSYMRNIHVPALNIPAVKVAVLALFAAAFLLSCAALPHLRRGLDQSVALPQDSYLQAYYSDVLSLLRVGPPVMFVVRDLNVSSDAGAVCSVAGCDSDSLLNQVRRARVEGGGGAHASGGFMLACMHA